MNQPGFKKVKIGGTNLVARLLDVVEVTIPASTVELSDTVIAISLSYSLE